jgi:hemolysin activation/secretion protein
MKLRLIASCMLLGLVAGSHVALAQDEKFDIFRFDIKGNTLLPPGQAEALVAPFLGTGRVYGDIQKALEILENAYRAKGYGTVNVHVPEQEITSGVVRLNVTEAVLGKILISGNKHFDEANVRASLPNLKEGIAPNLREISENVQLINENPAKAVEVTLATSEQDDKVDAKVGVTEQNPQRVFITMDNSGSVETTQHRIGVAYQNANLLGGDEVLTLAYTTSPEVLLDQIDDVKVDIYSVAFRKPFYGLGDSLDIIYGKSNVITPMGAQATAIALPSLTGKGEVFALRWNHLFPRQGEYSSKLVFGYDYKFINTTCETTERGTVGGGSCTPYTVQPVSATYSGQFQGIGYQAGYNLGLAYNFFSSGKSYAGSAGTLAATRDDKYSYILGRPVNDEFLVTRFGGSYAKLVEGWQLRAALNGQIAVGNALPSAEQFGLVGSTAVRGFSERAIASDSGHVINLEALTPNLASYFNAPGNLHGVMFYDFGYGRNVGNNGEDSSFNKITVGSAGVGIRYSYQKDVTFSWDAANILDPGRDSLGGGHGNAGDWRSHFKLTLGF